MQQKWHFTRRTNKGGDVREYAVTVIIDPEQVADALWTKAIRNKSRIARELGGIIRVTTQLLSFTHPPLE